MAWFPCKVGGSGGIPAQLQTDMDAVLNKKFGTSTTYPSTEWADDVNLMGLLPVRSASGAIASFSDGADDVPIKSGKFTFNAVQASGTPTPSVPIPISGFTGMTIHVADGEEPHVVDNTYPVTWSEEGTLYGGYVKVNSDGSAELWKTHGIYTFSGNEGWAQQGSLAKYYSQSYLVRNIAKCPASNSEAVTIVTSIGTFDTPYNVLENYPDTINIAADGRLTINASLKQESGTLAGVQVVYELATYVKVCDLPDINISTLLETNNIFHDANGDSEVEYHVNVNPTANLWGGLKMAQDISKGINGNNLVLTSDYVRFAASSITSGLPAIFSDFKENTQYTIILAFANSSVYSSNVVTPNLEFVYSDGTGETFNAIGVANTKYVVAVTSAEGKTISKISLYYNYGTSNIYYNECGLFEGVKTVDDFVPYNRYLIDV